MDGWKVGWLAIMEVVHVGCFLDDFMEFYKREKDSCKNRMKSSALWQRLVKESLIPKMFMISYSTKETDVRETETDREREGEENKN